MIRPTILLDDYQLLILFAMLLDKLSSTHLISPTRAGKDTKSVQPVSTSLIFGIMSLPSPRFLSVVALTVASNS